MWKKPWILVTAAIMGCSSISKSLQQIRAGMDKSEVLQIAGNPKFTFRLNSQDHWAYFYNSNNQEWRRDVVFENGKVIRVSRPATKERWQKDLEGSNNIEEYESIAREQQRKGNNFKYIDGLPDESGKNP